MTRKLFAPNRIWIPVVSILAIVLFALVNHVFFSEVVLSEESTLVKTPSNYFPLFAGKDFSVWRHGGGGLLKLNGTLVTVNTRTGSITEHKDIPVKTDHLRPIAGGEMGFYYSFRGEERPTPTLRWYYDEPTDKMLKIPHLGGYYEVSYFLYPYSREDNVQVIYTGASFHKGKGAVFMYSPEGNKTISELTFHDPHLLFEKVLDNGGISRAYSGIFPRNISYVHEGKIIEMYNGSAICRYSPNKDEIGTSTQIVEGVKQYLLCRTGEVIVLMCNEKRKEPDFNLLSQEYVTIDLKGNILARTTIDSQHTATIFRNGFRVLEEDETKRVIKIFNNQTFQFDEVFSTKLPEMENARLYRVQDKLLLVCFCRDKDDKNGIVTTIFSITEPTKENPHVTKKELSQFEQVTKPQMIGREPRFHVYKSFLELKRGRGEGGSIYVAKGGILARSIELLKSKE